MLARIAGGQALFAGAQALRPTDIVDGKPYYGPPPWLDAQPDLLTWSRGATSRVNAWFKDHGK